MRSHFESYLKIIMKIGIVNFYEKSFKSQCYVNNYDKPMNKHYSIRLRGIHSCCKRVYPCFVSAKINVISRTMYSSSAAKIASRCLVKNVRTYAKYTCNVAETNTTDPQGDINNPTVTKNGVSFRHSEFHRERCHESGCTKKVCTHLCGTFNDRKALGNATSSNSESTNLDSTLVKNVSSTLMNGKQGFILRLIILVKQENLNLVHKRCIMRQILFLL